MYYNINEELNRFIDTYDKTHDNEFIYDDEEYVEFNDELEENS